MVHVVENYFQLHCTEKKQVVKKVNRRNNIEIENTCVIKCECGISHG